MSIDLGGQKCVVCGLLIVCRLIVHSHSSINDSITPGREAANLILIQDGVRQVKYDGLIGLLRVEIRWLTGLS